MNRTPAPRARLVAVASGLLAATALTAPGAAADSGAGRPTAAQLTAAHAALARADIGGSAWHTNAATGTVVVTVDSTVDAGELTALTQAATTAAGAPEINRTTGILTKYVAGGEYIQLPGGIRCLVGFNVRDSAGIKYALTAGHCTNTGDVSSIGTTVNSSFPGNDYALIRYTDQSAAEGSVSLQNGTYQDITTAGNPTVGQQVMSSAPTAGVHSGTVTALNATVNYGGGDIVYGLVQTTLCAEPGSSGGPVFSGTRAIGLISGGSGNCASGGTTFAQPVVEPLAVYGVSVY
ncbi:Streptogrisin-A precursor [Streptomyces sp. S4.7]|uniref:S1 family peptidase n=1 Tax=Streptomyces sp. S4.7 TaxID=2705439 RepID=UPI0013991C23|nr:S1 family peptidase [Streptomyces sp. S4.7]QHY93613.1 Streptogrisin-A precursor [Streptomyces sp. S4.7]